MLRSRDITPSKSNKTPPYFAVRSFFFVCFICSFYAFCGFLQAFENLDREGKGFLTAQGIKEVVGLDFDAEEVSPNDRYLLSQRCTIATQLAGSNPLREWCIVLGIPNSHSARSRCSIYTMATQQAVRDRDTKKREGFVVDCQRMKEVVGLYFDIEVSLCVVLIVYIHTNHSATVTFSCVKRDSI